MYSSLSKDAKAFLNGSRKHFSLKEKIEIEKELLNEDYDRKDRAVNDMSMVTSAQKISLRYLLCELKIKDLEVIEHGKFRYFKDETVYVEFLNRLEIQ